MFRFFEKYIFIQKSSLCFILQIVSGSCPLWCSEMKEWADKIENHIFIREFFLCLSLSTFIRSPFYTPLQSWSLWFPELKEWADKNDPAQGKDELGPLPSATSELLMCKMCARCAQDVRKMCARIVQDVLNMCARCAQDVRKMCARCVQDVCKVCSICVQDVCTLHMSCLIWLKPTNLENIAHLGS